MGRSIAAMSRIGAVLTVGASVLFVAAEPGGAAAGAALGQALYQSKCAGCHSVDADRIGPRHRNVVGRRIASVPGYAYSPALRRLGGVWTPARLDQFLRGTQKMVPGSKMYLQLDDPEQRRLIVGYLGSVSKPKK